MLRTHQKAEELEAGSMAWSGKLRGVGGSLPELRQRTVASVEEAPLDLVHGRGRKTGQGGARKGGEVEGMDGRERGSLCSPESVKYGGGHGGLRRRNPAAWGRCGVRGLGKMEERGAGI